MKLINDLRVCDWQYEICHLETNLFVTGEIVFMKSSAHYPMIVCFIGKKEVSTLWENTSGEMQCESFPPECILQYRYAGLLVWCGKYKICLN